MSKTDNSTWFLLNIISVWQPTMILLAPERGLKRLATSAPDWSDDYGGLLISMKRTIIKENPHGFANATKDH